MNNEPKQLNFNTALLTLVNVLVIVIGFFAKHELERVESVQAKLWEGMMPRHEIEVQFVRIEGEQLEFRRRMSLMELDIAAIKAKLINQNKP